MRWNSRLNNFVGKLVGFKGFQCNASENNFKLNEPIKWSVEEMASREHDTDIHCRHLCNESYFQLRDRYEYFFPNL